MNNLLFATPLEELAKRADHIVYGEVEGDAGEGLTFKSLGAEIDGSPYFSEEMARFSRGEAG